MYVSQLASSEFVVPVDYLACSDDDDEELPTKTHNQPKSKPGIVSFLNKAFQVCTLSLKAFSLKEQR